jgi:hypothetical protein
MLETAMLREQAWVDPTNRQRFGVFSAASCENGANFAWREEFGKGKLEDVPFTGLVPYFTEHAHPNLPAAVEHLVNNHDVKFTCSIPVVDPENVYWTTGRENSEHHCQITEVPPGFAGSNHMVVQVLSAGLACVYKNGAQNQARAEQEPHFYSRGYNAPDDLDVHFKFEGQHVCLQLMGAARSDIGHRVIHIVAGSW